MFYLQEKSLYSVYIKIYKTKIENIKGVKMYTNTF